MFVQVVGLLQRKDAVDAKQRGTVQHDAKPLTGERLTDMSAPQRWRKQMMLDIVYHKRPINQTIARGPHPPKNYC
jgi:hypothetical protein